MSKKIHEHLICIHSKNIRFRFLNSSGSVSKPDYFIPFGTGKRTCLGDGLVKATLFLGLSTLLQNFEILLPEGFPQPDIHDIPGLVVPRSEILLVFRRLQQQHTAICMSWAVVFWLSINHEHYYSISSSFSFFVVESSNCTYGRLVGRIPSSKQPLLSKIGQKKDDGEHLDPHTWNCCFEWEKMNSKSSFHSD